MSKPIITVKNLTKIARGRVILSNLSFTISKRSLVSLIGPNGAGKSTLVKILLGLDSDYQGEVSIDHGETVAYIPQIDPRDSTPLPLSVQEYIAVGTTPLYSGKNVRGFNFEEIMKHVGVNPEISRQSFWSLSGGERQRIAIARALLIEPTILVLDEPLSAIDYASRQDLYELIRHLQQDHDMTAILVSHDIDNILPISDRVLCLNQTLHKDCHPCEYTNESLGKMARVHHHC